MQTACRPVPGFVLLTALLGPVPAGADVTIEQAFKVDAVGTMSALVAEGTVTTAIAGRRSRTDNRVQAAAETMLRQARIPNGSLLVSLDARRMVSLLPETRQYSAAGFDQVRAQLDYGTRAIEEAQANGELMNLPVAEQDCYWFLPDTSVAHTREQGSFAGIAAERHVFTARQTCLVEDTGQECDLKWRLERWQADDMPGAGEAQAFQAELAGALAGADLLSAASLNAGGLLALFRQGWNPVLSQAAELPGYPVKTVMSLEMGGEFCTTGAGQPIARDSDWNVVKEVARDTARNSAVNTAANTVATTVARTVGGGLGGIIAGSAADMGTRRVLDRIGEDEEEQPAPPGPQGSPGTGASGDSVLLFSVSSELTGVSTDTIPAERFEIPDGWRESTD